MNISGLLLKVAARIPLPALYFLSSGTAWMMERVVRYRRGVIRSNLAMCFPEKSESERRKIEKKFYRHFTDYIVETLKLMHISDAEMARRMQFTNLDIIDRHLKAGRSVVVYFAHTFNWEWAPAISLHSEVKPSDTVKFAQIYRPLKSKRFDRLMLALRSRFRSESIAKYNTARTLLQWRKDGVVSVTGFMSDQHPGYGDGGYPLMFLGQPTLMISGTETIARKFGMAVVFWDMSSPSRGHYVIDVKEITPDASTMSDGAVTRCYARMLEQSIRRDPSLWLWSHKRWKHPLNEQQIKSAHENA